VDDGEEDARGTLAGQRSVVVVRRVPDGEGSSLRAAVHAKLG
jgi:hypothetical protein